MGCAWLWRLLWYQPGPSLLPVFCGCFPVHSLWLRAPQAPIPAPATLHPTPTSYSLPATSLATDLQNTRADIRRQVAATFDPTPIPEEDDDMHDALPDNNEPLPANVDEAFAHLLQAVDQMHATPPQLPSFDSQHYLALSHLPLTYPWPILVLDLKSYIPLLERHVITHMVAGRCNLQEEHSHPGFVLNSLLRDLAQTIVHNILFPATSAFMRPALPPRIATVEFWHAQLNYAVLQAEAALATGGSAEGIAGDQLCLWNTIAPDAIIPSTHLTLFLPPSLGAYVMANHQSHREFKSHPSSSASDIPTFTVQQGLHFPLPEVLKYQVELLNMARYAAADGYITPAAIPLLSHSLTGEHMTFQKIKWSLRFPLPTPDPSDPSRRFSSTPSFHNSPSSGEALEGAIRVAAPFNYLSPPTTLLTTSEFLRLHHL